MSVMNFLIHVWKIKPMFAEQTRFWHVSDKTYVINTHDKGKSKRNALTVDLDLGRGLSGAGPVLREADVLVVVLGAGILDDEDGLQGLKIGHSYLARPI